jgi:glucokinase
VSLSELRALGIDRVEVVNDFVAVAHAVQCMRDGDSLLPGDRAGPPPPGPTLVVGPGTGLGAAVRVPHGDGAVVLPCEAGQLAFAPGNAREIAVLAKMLEAGPYVSSEQVVSGPGLFKLYATLCAIDGVDVRQDTPSAVVEAARRGDDTHAVEAVRIFCEAFGSLLGDLVIASAATSVYIAGGIVPRIRDLFDAGAFRARFVNKGLMRKVLEQVPVRLIDNPHNGVIGAAAWYLAQPRAD